MLASDLTQLGLVCFGCLGWHTSKPLKLKPNEQYDITGQEVECWTPYCRKCKAYKVNKNGWLICTCD